MMVFICIKQHLTTFEAQFMKKLGTTEAELKKKRLLKACNSVKFT